MKKMCLLACSLITVSTTSFANPTCPSSLPQYPETTVLFKTDNIGYDVQGNIAYQTDNEGKVTGCSTDSTKIPKIHIPSPHFSPTPGPAPVVASPADVTYTFFIGSTLKTFSMSQEGLPAGNYTGEIFTNVHTCLQMAADHQGACEQFPNIGINIGFYKSF